jgi:hypothetical protein
VASISRIVPGRFAVLARVISAMSFFLRRDCGKPLKVYCTLPGLRGAAELDSAAVVAAARRMGGYISALR